MGTLTPEFSVAPYIDRGEVHFTAKGLWDEETLVAFQRKIIEAGQPLFSEGKRMRVFGDLTGFVTQPPEIVEGIRIIMRESAKLGADKTAIVSDSILAAMQYKRMDTGLETEIFNQRGDALAWLRREAA